MLRGRAGAGAAPRAAVTTLLLAALSLVLGLASAAPRIVPGTPAIQEELLVKDAWLFERDFFFKRDQPQNGRTFVTVRQNRLARFRSGEVAYWKVENRPIPGQKKGALAMTGQDLLVLDVPDQGDKKDLIVSYEIPVGRGRYHPSAIRFGQQGNIFVAKSKEDLIGPAAYARKRIGTFKVSLKTVAPLVDRAYTI